MKLTDNQRQMIRFLQSTTMREAYPALAIAKRAGLLLHKNKAESEINSLRDRGLVEKAFGGYQLTVAGREIKWG